MNIDEDTLRQILRTELQATEARLDAKFDDMESRFDVKFDAMESKFDAKFDTMESKFDVKFDDMESRFDVKFDAMETQLDTKFTLRIKTLFEAQEKRLDVQLAKFFGMTNRRLDKLDDTKADRSQVEKLQNTMDGFAGLLHTQETERAFMNHQLDRHERWFSELAHNTGTTLSPP